MRKKRIIRFETKVIHAGQKSEPYWGGNDTYCIQILQMNNQVQGVHKGYDYSRSINPTREAFENCIAI